MDLLGQDPGENTSKIVSDLSNTDLPELMAMVLVFASISLMLYMVFKIALVMRMPKQPPIPEETPNDKLIDVLQSVITTVETLKSINQNQQTFATIMDGLITSVGGLTDSINTGNQASGKQHIDFLSAMQSVKTEVHQGLDKVVKATNTMTDKLTPVVQQLLDKLSEDRGISADDKQDIADSVVAGLSESIINLWQTNKMEFVSAVSDEIVKAISARATTPQAEPQTNVTPQGKEGKTE